MLLTSTWRNNFASDSYSLACCIYRAYPCH
eukprot:COSAG02_NODE_64496_length_260_cov_0.819876_1_plen_29_part_01